MRAAAAAIAGLLLALAACSDSNEAPLVAEEILRLNERANRVAIGLEHYVASEGIRRAKVVADTAFFIEEESLIELRDMEVTFYDEDGKETTFLTAREGTYDWETGNMTARHDVVVVKREEGRRIETSVMYYERPEDRIWSDVRTTMYEEDGTIVEGTSFTSNSGMDRVELTEPSVIRRGSQPRSEE
ncbi:MAG: LPS export ABC transporter periplasmic protein LptC [Gemmatimonadetes bacterium]|uniref:LPS export ABC transporter periplasmic protein LptC n=1 Tax=Candidatus Kutchimonas denitrificans TaxID=3056748 RepID=A0AAE5CB26_9BACT|nr:LPS export ABC transporter periplasmic protein LptC [Gemmatimonadota bacterium]NIR75242.1 LPS export ABC transporter periplasmic protein LptC [Candidatus Kutchimonas denitrificans]NIS00180.1 LPS export ABC transporter periplasmic protein LptC [Gemmatimonadota bacterium]NIT65772.1 LPS export ABC transporter periplasmic protein LptC [Gemmatimonadota bacterium]NIU53050.1 LPS export ABC transporter periplasmic protein LptC [Gemmatimonadota bacterium]